ncbi:MAG: damage-control phosphatase, subfamily [Kosmotogales bacterium]|nr:damage-control phosphatase, subfamily [Kosmotogales bacterium]
MLSSPECLTCNLNSMLKTMREHGLSEKETERIFLEIFRQTAKMDFSLTPVEIGRILGKIVTGEMGIEDLFREEKVRSNDELLSIYDDLKKIIEKSENKLLTALKLSVAGNTIDVGPGHEININETMERVLKHDFAIDKFDLLLEELKNAKTLLYIGDNCGETVLDKLCIEYINVPEIVYVVRSEPTLNDVTMKEAKEIGMDSVAKVIEGTDGPGAILNESTDEFKYYFKNADVIISKGQGNFEGLSDLKRKIYFLLIAKCDVIAKYIGVEKGSFIVTTNSQ